MNFLQALLKNKIGPNAKIGRGTIIYGSTIGRNANIGSYVHIENAVIGNDCHIGNQTLIYSGLTIEDDCIIAHAVCFTNDKLPTIERYKEITLHGNFVPQKSTVRRGAFIGANATILPGIEIGSGAVIGAGSVVTKSVPAGETWVGNPARKLK